jgi:hypothetical protein
MENIFKLKQLKRKNVYITNALCKYLIGVYFVKEPSWAGSFPLIMMCFYVEIFSSA